MKNKNLLKLLFDLVMVLIFALMYNTSATGIAFHEYGGLILLGLFVVHIAYNWKWVVNVGKRLFLKECKIKQRVMYCLNCLLILSFTLSCISGIMISRVIFISSVKAPDLWLTMHIASSLCALIFIGFHIGLHWKFIMNALKKLIIIPNKFRTAMTMIFVVLTIVGGVYGTVTVGGSLFEKLTPKAPHNLTDASDIHEKGQQKSGHDSDKGEAKQEAAITPVGFFTAGLTPLSMTLMLALLTYGIEKRYNQSMQGRTTHAKNINC